MNALTYNLVGFQLFYIDKRAPLLGTVLIFSIPESGNQTGIIPVVK